MSVILCLEIRKDNEKRKKEFKMTKYNLKQIMKDAWDLAKTAAYNKGGKAVEYIGETLKQAWVVAKLQYASKHGLTGLDGNKMTLAGSNRQPMYLAVVTGLSAQYGLNRQFEDAPHRGTVLHTFELENNKVYNWKEAREQFFGIFKNGKMQPLSQDEVKAIFA